MALAIDITDGCGLSNEACCVFILLLKSYITKVLEYKGDLNKIIKFECIAMCSLVMSLYSCDISISNNYLIYNTL